MKFQSGITAENLDLGLLPKEVQADLARIWLAQVGKREVRLTVRFQNQRIESIFVTNRKMQYHKDAPSAE